MKNYIHPFDCQGEYCGSPTYGNVEGKWIFETNRMELRVVCGGCGHVQSKEYSDDLINGKIKPPVSGLSGEWFRPDHPYYEEIVHYTFHEKLIQIIGMPRKQVLQSQGRKYPHDY